MGTIDEILAIDDSQSVTLEIPEWNGITLRVCSMTALERAEIEKRWSGKATAQKDPAGFRADVLAQTLKNGSNEPLFTPEQSRMLMRKNAAIIERLFEAACELNGFTKKDVEVLEKN